MSKETGNIWSYTVPAGTTGLLFNAGDGDATKTPDFEAKANHVYTTAGDQGLYDGGNGDEDPGLNTSFNVYFDNSSSNWTTPHIHYWGASESTWPGVAMSKETGNIWKYTVPAGTTGLLFNAGDGDATKTPDFEAKANHIYTIEGDKGVYNGGNDDDPKPNPNPNPNPNPGTLPASLYLIGNVNGYGWATDKGVEATGKGGVYTWSSVTIDDAGGGYGYFSFATVLSSAPEDWDTVNGGDRYGSEANDTPVALGESVAVVCYPVNVSAMGATSWMITPGQYSLTVDLNTDKLTVGNPGSSAVESLDSDDDAPAQYFNLQGVKVDNPVKGIYIVVKGNKTMKVAL